MNSSVVYAKSNFLSTSALIHCPARSSFAKPFRLTTFGCLNTKKNANEWIAPLELKTPAGKLLSNSLLEDQDTFLVKARKELVQLAADRDHDEARLKLSLGVLEDCLSRRIAGVKKHERQEVAEDVMYALIVHKFSEIKAPLIPPLSLCTLEISPFKTLELDSVFPSEFLEVVKNKVNHKISKLLSILVDFCTRFELCLWYSGCVDYGYFLRSCFLRYQLESSLKLSDIDGVKFKEYLDRFDGKMKWMCWKSRSKEVANLEKRHMNALFGDDDDDEEMVSVSPENLMRYAHEGVAFGYFLLEIENWVDDMYCLERI